MLKILLFLLLLVPITSFAQLDEERFEEYIQSHGWHPTERGLLLFEGVHTVVVHNNDIENKNVRLAGIDPETGEKFNFEGKGVLRIENNYFEIALDDTFSSVTKYFAGTIVSDERIKFCASSTPFELSDEGMKNVVWFDSRF